MNISVYTNITKFGNQCLNEADMSNFEKQKILCNIILMKKHPLYFEHLMIFSSAHITFEILILNKIRF